MIFQDWCAFGGALEIRYHAGQELSATGAFQSVFRTVASVCGRWLSDSDPVTPEDTKVIGICRREL